MVIARQLVAGSDARQPLLVPQEVPQYGGTVDESPYPGTDKRLLNTGPEGARVYLQGRVSVRSHSPPFSQA
jgi:hypothetical protein